jgi:hypothetical protein
VLVLLPAPEPVLQLVQVLRPVLVLQPEPAQEQAPLSALTLSTYLSQAARQAEEALLSVQALSLAYQ